MAGGVGALTVSLGLDAADYVQGLSKAERQAKSASEGITNNFTTAIRGASLAFTALAAAGAGAFIALNNQVRTIADFQDLSEKVGDTASNLASLQLAAQLSGTSIDEVAAASIKLTATLSKTNDESKGAGAAIKALGLNFTEFKNLSPVEQLDAVSKALAGFEDGASKTAVAVALFGKAGAQILPFLNDLADEGERQIKLTDEQIAQADEYVKSQDRLRAQITATSQSLAGDALPAFIQFQNVIAKIIKAFTESQALSTILKVSLSALGFVFGQLASVGALIAYSFTAIGKTIGFAAAAAQAFFTGDFGAIKPMFNALREDSYLAKKELTDFLNEVEGKTKTVSVKTGVSADAQKPLEFAAAQDKVTKSVIETNRAATDLSNIYSDLLRSAENLARPEGETQADRLERELNSVSNLDAGVRQYIETIIAQKRATDALAESEEERRQIIAENVRLQIEALKEAEDERFEAVKAQALEQKKLLEDQQDEYKDLERAIDGFAKKSAESLADFAFGSKTSFSEMVNSFLKDLARLALQKSIFDPIAKSFGGLFESSGVSGGISSLFSGLGFANGGSPPVGKASLVGERGKELFVPKSAGTIIPNHALGGSQTNNVSITINSDGSSTQQGNPNTVAKQIEAAVVNVLLKQKRNGGVLA
jgi:hypothetical protein